MLVVYHKCGPRVVRSVFVAVCLLATVAAHKAAAQNYNTEIVPVPDSVTARLRPDYDALGIRTGSFLLKPSAAVAEVYDDNIYATNVNRTSDFITVIQPKIDLDSQWSRHAFDISLSGDLGYHASATNEDYVNLNALQDARIDIGGSDSLTETASFQRYQESRSSVDDRKGLSPVKVFVKSGALEYKHQGGLFFGSIRATISDSNFHDTFQSNGLIINNHDRDRTEGSGSIEVGLDSGGLIRPFVQVNGVKVDFKEPVDNFGFNRDSAGYAINGGLLFPVTALMQGRVFAGYIARNFSDPLLTDVHTVGYGGEILWSPLRLTSIDISGLRTVNETTLNLASAALVSSLGIAIDQEIRENLLLHGGVRYERDRYTGIPRSDGYWEAQFKLAYLMNHRLRASLGYDHSTRNAKNVPPDNDFRRNQIDLTIHLQI
jgi:hypothetical protein